jgi:NAD(P)-dependent dehydrogenase (short-subunit alcohol dehydrogenase family)
MAEKVAVLTGGAGKMGGGICRALEKVDIASAALDLDLGRVENAAKAIVCDVTDERACAAAIEEIVCSCHQHLHHRPDADDGRRNRHVPLRNTSRDDPYEGG